jgi:hypothetical protein
MIHGMESRLFVSLGTAAFLFSACSDSTQNASNTDGGPDGSTADAMNAPDGNHGGEGGVVEAAAPAMLGSGVAGKACAMNSDCPTGGMCAMQIDLGGPLAMFTGGGMQAPAPGGYCTASCMTDSSCGSGGSCVGGFSGMGMSAPGTCEKTCMQDSDCRTGYRCAGLPLAGVDSGSAMSASPLMLPSTPGCVPIPMTAMLSPGTAGKPCSMDSDCSTGGTCLTTSGGGFGPGTSYPGGYCSGNCLKDGDCGGGGGCVLPVLGQGAGTCYQKCTADTDCRSGYRCRDQGEGFSACVPGDPKIPNGQVGQACNVPDSGTVPVADGATVAVADADTDAGMSSDCGSVCMSSLGGALAMFMGGGMAAPGGYCSANCVDDSDCGGGLCLGAISFPGLSGTGICFKTCSADTDCRTGYACTAYTNPLAAFTGGGMTGDAGTPTVCQPSM